MNALNIMTIYRLLCLGNSYVLAGLLMCSVAWVGNASAIGVEESVKTIVADDAPQLIAAFKQFHQNPELGFQEFETAAAIAEHLEKLGYPIKKGVVSEFILVHSIQNMLSLVSCLIYQETRSNPNLYLRINIDFCVYTYLPNVCICI